MKFHHHHKLIIRVIKIVHHLKTSAIFQPSPVPAPFSPHIHAHSSVPEHASNTGPSFANSGLNLVGGQGKAESAGVAELVGVRVCSVAHYISVVGGATSGGV